MFYYLDPSWDKLRFASSLRMEHFLPEEGFLFFLFLVLGLLSFCIRTGKYCLSWRAKGLQARCPPLIIYSNCLPIQCCHFCPNLTIKSCSASPAKSVAFAVLLAAHQSRGGEVTAWVGELPGWMPTGGGGGACEND